MVIMVSIRSDLAIKGLLNAICWLDEDGGKGTKKAEIIIASNDNKPG